MPIMTNPSSKINNYRAQNNDKVSSTFFIIFIN